MPDIEVQEQKISKNVPLHIETPIPPTPEEVAAAAALVEANKPPVPTAEQLEVERRRSEVLASVGWQEEPKPAAAPATPAAPASPATVVPPAKPPETDAEREQRLIATTVRQTVEAVTPLLKPAAAPAAPAPPTAPPVTDPSLDPEDAEDLEAVRHLETTQPEKYKGKAQEMADYYKAHYTYRTAWQAANPGKEYDPAAEEHTEFMDKHLPDLPIKVLDDAREDVKFEKRYQARIQPQEEAQRAQQAQAAAQPVILKAVTNNLLKLVKGVDPKLAAVVMAGDKPDFSPAGLAKLEEADPIAFDVLDVVGRGLAPVIDALERTVVPGLNFRLNPDNPVHAEILSEMIECEAIFSKAPPEIQNRNGRRFMTLSDMEAARNAIASSGGTAAEQQAKIQRLMAENWALTVDDLAQTLTDKRVAAAQKEIARRNSIAEKKFKGTATAQNRPAAAPTPPAPVPPAPPARHRPPSISTQSDVVPTPGTAPAGPQKFGDVAAKTHFG